MPRTPTHTPARRLFPLPGVAALCAALVLIAIAAPGSARPGSPPFAAPASTPDLALLHDHAADLPARLAAATRLIQSPEPESRAALLALLDPVAPGPPTPEPKTPDAQLILLRALAALPSAPPFLLTPLTALAQPPSGEAPSPSRREAVIAAVTSIRTREAARWLLDLTADGTGQDAALAFTALARLTGRTEHGRDPAKWSLWYGRVQWLPEAEWRRELSEGLAARADTLHLDRDRAIERLLTALRQMYLGTESIADRSARLAEHLRDPQPEIRRLGLSLAIQELANARRLDGPVGAAAVELLDDPDPAFRREAARLVGILAPDAQSDRILAALLRETQPPVAAELLRAAARWPEARLVPVCLTWLESGVPTAPPACDLIDAVHRGGGLTDPEAVARVRSSLRAWDAATLGPLPSSGIRILYALGDGPDRTRIDALLHDPDPDRRLAVASALVPVPAATPALIAAAAIDPRLFAPAAQALAASPQPPSAAAYRRLAAVSGVPAELRRESLVAVASALRHPDLYQVAFETTDPAMREAMLARLLTEPVAVQRLPGGGGGAGRTQKPAVVAGLLLLADARVGLGQPAGALAALDALAPMLDAAGARGRDGRRCSLLLWLDRIDEAGRLDAPLSAWLDGLEHAVALPHARTVLAAIDGRFTTGVSGTEAERLQGLRLAVDRAGQR